MVWSGSDSVSESGAGVEVGRVVVAVRLWWLEAAASVAVWPHFRDKEKLWSCCGFTGAVAIETSPYA